MNHWDAIVIGAGPAGISAATRLAAAGAQVLVVDENPSPGGQIWRGIATASPQRIGLLGPDYLSGKKFVERLLASQAHLALDTRLWRIEPNGAVWLHTPTGMEQHQAKNLLLATGTLERPVPVPGWTLPGVTTIGGLQILLKKKRPAPRRAIDPGGCGTAVLSLCRAMHESGQTRYRFTGYRRPGRLGQGCALPATGPHRPGAALSFQRRGVIDRAALQPYSLLQRRTGYCH
ncbi:FAD-dependent oxidoreductase [Acerihabitans sp. KWT182]|uniref:FAD-dependent oxidoreductase n=1 Tax=Acerihabitans sp. KWT182 TaxID=3157919 RepID=A0AAU7Q6A2_9GAMM